MTIADSSTDARQTAGNFVARLFRGDVSLPITFWLWGVLIGGGISLMADIVRVFYHRPVRALQYGQYILDSLTYIEFGYWAFIVIALWRCAGKFRGNARWAKAVRASIVVAAVLLLSVPLIFLFGTH